MILRLPETPELRSVRRAAEIIRGSGREVMLVGGAVRDLLNCRRPSDYDLVTTARPDELAALFPDYLLAGKSFGVGLLKLDGMTAKGCVAEDPRLEDVKRLAGTI